MTPDLGMFNKPAVFVALMSQNFSDTHIMFKGILSRVTEFGLITGFIKYLKLVTTDDLNTP